jgi:hypothetical protein
MYRYWQKKSVVFEANSNFPREKKEAVSKFTPVTAARHSLNNIVISHN